MIVDGNTVTFSTGRQAYCHRGIFGIGAGGEDFSITHGYDGSFLGLEDLTPQEATELADHMIGRWAQVKRLAQRRGG